MQAVLGCLLVGAACSRALRLWLCKFTIALLVVSSEDTVPDHSVGRRCILQGGYEHYMQKEIHEQPEALTQTMRGRVAVERTKEVGYGAQTGASASTSVLLSCWILVAAVCVLQKSTTLYLVDSEMSCSRG